MNKKRIEKPKMYIVRKYIKAVDVKQALKREPSTPVHDLYIDSDWQKDHLSSAIGFNVDSPNDEDYE